MALGDVMDLIAYWIADVPTPRHVFSLHNIVNAGARYGNGPGAWVGPNGVCQALRCVRLAPGLAYRTLLAPCVHPAEAVAHTQW